LRLPAGPAAGVAAFDEAVDEAIGRLLRDRTVADRIMYTASALGDHGLLWMLLAGAQAARRRRGDWRRPLLRALIGLGAESALVNGPVKWMFRRDRPVQSGPRPMHLRQPRTSSFPSGHASAAFFGAALLRDDDPWWPVYYVVAVVVAASRVHVRIHHASDVVGGAVVGIVLGEAARALAPVRRQAGAAFPSVGGADPPA
jgi:undecaprenyl-diphosphatase